MFVESIELLNYRNYHQLHIDLHQGTNVFYGDAEACREMLVTGGGIATDLSVGYVSEFIANSTIHSVLPGWHREPWTFYVYCRAAQSEDKLIREVMALIAKSAFAQISNRWEFWYKRLGLPFPEELTQKSR